LKYLIYPVALHVMTSHVIQDFKFAFGFKETHQFKGMPGEIAFGYIEGDRPENKFFIQVLIQCSVPVTNYSTAGHSLFQKIFSLTGSDQNMALAMVDSINKPEVHDSANG
jgi:hypothetical protein